MTDKGTIRIVVLFLGLITLLLVGGAFFLISIDKNVPDPIWGLSGTALGAFVSMLVSTRSAPEAPAEVNVVNAPNAPVPVVEGP